MVKTTEMEIKSMMERPIPKKKIGIIRLKVEKEQKSRWGMKRFRSPKEAVEAVSSMFAYSDREIVAVLSFNSKMEPMAAEIVAVGGLNASYVDVKNVFKFAILNQAAYVMCFHNHPSGDPEASPDDEKLTARLTEAGELLGIPLADHIILGDGSFYSFREHKWMDKNGVAA